MKKLTGIFAVLMLAMAFTLSGCGEKESTAKIKSNYVKPEVLKEAIDKKSDEYVVLDVRKLEDFKKTHIKGAIDADVHKANKEGDNASGVEHLKAALKKATGSETGVKDKKYALVCYTGKSYANKATELLNSMGVNNDQIFTLEGGMKKWQSSGDEYKSLLN